MSAPECGGCQGLGSHRRWCEAKVGRSAAYIGTLAERAESLGDSIGPNETGAANYVWHAAALLREKAERLATQHQERENSPHALGRVADPTKPTQ